jgi:hypothetical protein
MQLTTVYVPVSVTEALPHHQQEVAVTGYTRMDKCFIRPYKSGLNDHLIGFFDHCGNLVTGYDKDNGELKRIHWLKETTAYLLSKEDAESIRVMKYNDAFELAEKTFPDKMIGMDEHGVFRYRSGYAKGFIDALTILNKVI